MNIKTIAENLRYYNAWRRNNDDGITLEMPNPVDIGKWIDDAVSVLEIAADQDQTKENEYLEKLNSFKDVLAQRDYLLSILVKIVTETMDYPPVRPSSADSWIPRELVSEAQAAIASVRGNPVPTYQDLNT